jgi:hypothetical protein
MDYEVEIQRKAEQTLLQRGGVMILVDREA